MCTLSSSHGSLCRFKSAKRNRAHHRGAIIVLTMLLMIALLGILAFAVDLGVLTTIRTESQRTADAAALAGGWVLINENRLKGPDYAQAVLTQSRSTVADYCQRNPVFNQIPTLNTSPYSQDLIIGRFVAPDSVVPTLSPAQANAILVQVHREGVPFFFGRIFGATPTQISAKAIATFRDGISGFRTPREGHNSSLMPFAVKLSDWLAVLSRSAGTDNYRVDPDTGAVSSGSDGLHELVMFPDRVTGSGIVPGNFGTVDIGSAGNSNADLKRQVLEGPSASDFSYYEGGELKLGPDGTLLLSGDTGVSSGMELAVDQTIGAGPRTIFLYTEVYNPGNQAQFVIVGFAGVRVLACNFNGVHKYILIQPAVVTDDSAIVEDGPTNYTVYQPVILVK
jgi:hypothetical protein